MSALIKLIRKLVKQGFATKEDKAKVKELFNKLDDEDKEVIKPDLKQAEDLPEEDPEDSDLDSDSDEEDDDDDDVDEKSIAKLFKKHGDKVKSEVLDELKKEVKTWIKEQKENAEKKVGIYAPEAKKEREARVRTNEYLRALCNAVIKGEKEFDAKVKELSTSSSGSPYGGYIVDAELSAEIRHLITEYGVARREMLGLQLTKNSYKANELITDVSVYWVDEAGAISSSQVVLGQNELSLKKLGVIVSMTAELLEDQEIDLFAFIASRVAEGFAKAEDDAFFKGDGTSDYGSFTGLLESDSVNEVTMAGTTFASLDADDLIDMVDATPSGALANAKFYINRTNLSYIRKLKDDNGQYIYQRPSDGGPGTIWGYPVVLVESMPKKTDTAAATSFVLFGDLKKGCIFGYKGALRVERFNAGIIKDVAGTGTINLITTDREAIRWIERVGYMQVITTLNKPITKLTTAASA